MFSKISFVSIYLSCVFFVLSESAIVDILNKCTLTDQECHKKLFSRVLQEDAKGIPELGMKPMDPYSITDPIQLAIDGVINLKVASAVVEGISKCTLDKSLVNMDKKHLEYIFNCPELKFVGGYELGKSPVVNNVLGKEVTGNGKAVVTIPDAVVNGIFAFKVEERDGKIYFVQRPKETTTAYQVNGDVSFNVDNIRVEDEDVSGMVNGLLNQNSKILVPLFSESIGNIIMEILFSELRKFLDGVSANNFIIDDLSAFVDK